MSLKQNTRKSPEPSRSRFLRRLGHEFADGDLLTQALTHRSAGRQNNERLEFLGDGLLNCVIAAELFRHCPEAAEGDLSRLRASLVRESTLAELAAELSLSAYLKLGPGESGSQRRASVLADAFEAVLGAIYLDAGFKRVEEVIKTLFAERLRQLPDPETLKDPKTRLQEHLQAQARPLPEYSLIESSGPAHKKHFLIACQIPGEAGRAEGAGSSRRKAEQAAALALLTQLLEDSD